MSQDQQGAHNLRMFKLCCGYGGLALLALDALCGWGTFAEASPILHANEQILGIGGKTGATLSALVFWFDRKGI